MCVYNYFNEYNLNPIGLNRHFTIDAIAKIIVAEMDGMPTEKLLGRLQDLLKEGVSDVEIQANDDKGQRQGHQGLQG